MYSVYILESQIDRKYYIGFSKDSTKRLTQYNGRYVTSTKNRSPLTLVYQEEFQTKAEAEKRENEFKNPFLNSISAGYL